MDKIQLLLTEIEGSDQLDLQMEEGKGRALRGKLGSIMCKPWLIGGEKTAFSITSGNFRVRHDTNEF